MRMKHNKIAKWIMIITGAITIALVPIAIFVPMFVFVHIEDVYMFQYVIGAFALLFGMIFVVFGLFLPLNANEKEGKDDA